MPSYTGGFNRERFWDEFVDKHTINNEHELLELILDMARSHWSPKPENWPGLEIKINLSGGASIDIKLQPGKTKIKSFSRGKGNVWNWTASCLATGAIFEQVYRKTAGVNCKLINGNWEGATQFMNLVHGFTLAHYGNCAKTMSDWVKATIPSKARPAEIDAKVLAAATAAINARDKANSAFSLINAANYCTGNAFDVSHQVEFTAVHTD
jgi:hypothetical protein